MNMILEDLKWSGSSGCPSGDVVRGWFETFLAFDPDGI